MGTFGLMHPILFVHGLGPSAKAYKMMKLKSYMSKKGVYFIIHERPRLANMAERAEVLRDAIQNKIGDNRFHLVGHSAGGLDSRMCVDRYDEVAKNCLSVTTMGSPHGGTPLAAMVLDPGCNLKASALNYFVDSLDAEEVVREMTPEFVSSVNIKDRPQIKYICLPHIMKRSRSYSLAKNTYDYLIKAGYPDSDGTVPYASQIHGEIILGKDGEPLKGSHAAEIATIWPFSRYGFFPWSTIWKRNMDLIRQKLILVEKDLI